MDYPPTGSRSTASLGVVWDRVIAEGSWRDGDCPRPRRDLALLHRQYFDRTVIFQ